MPAKNIIKEYVENGYYHIYNRGVEKRNIFLDEQDCKVFLFYLKIYLSPIQKIEELIKENPLKIRIRRFVPLNLSQELDLLSFALMPNHIHLQIKQYTKDAIIKFMRRLSTSYVMYFNKKYKRIGALFQNIYKACFLKSEAQLLHLSRYIHTNPTKVGFSKINFMDFSSYPYYLGLRKADWVKPQEILGYFRSAQKEDLKDILSYQSFVEDNNAGSEELLGSSMIEDDNV